MRAVVTAPFHNPDTGVMHNRGDELVDADIKPLLDHPELLHRLAFTDRTPAAEPMPSPVVPAVPHAAEKE